MVLLFATKCRFAAPNASGGPQDGAARLIVGFRTSTVWLLRVRIESAFLSLATPAMAQDQALSGEQIEAAWVGKKVFGRSLTGALLDMHLRADGESTVCRLRQLPSLSWRVPGFRERLGEVLAVFIGGDLDLLGVQVDLDPGGGGDELAGLRNSAGAVALIKRKRASARSFALLRRGLSSSGTAAKSRMRRAAG